MSLAAVFEPRRFSRLLMADAQNVGRDPILAFGMLVSLVPAILLPVFRADIDAAALAAFGLDGLSRYLAGVAQALPAFLVGWVTGFLLLEDRDDGPLLAMEVTPIGKAGFFAYRVAITALLGVAVGLFTARMVFPELGWGLTFFLAILVAAEAVIVAFALLALAANKVEGLAVTKLLNLGALFPLAAIAPFGWRYAAGIVPSYWIGEMAGLSLTSYLPVLLNGALAVAIHIAAAAFTFRLAIRRLG